MTLLGVAVMLLTLYIACGPYDPPPPVIVVRGL